MSVDEKDTITFIQETILKVGSSREDLIPILKLVTNKFGYISPTAIREISTQLKLPPKEITSVATFYSMLSTQPRGKHVIQFCESAPCHVVGGREVFQALKDALQLEPGQTSADDKWTLLTTSCLGVCGIGPVIMIDTDIYGDVKPEQVKSILSRYE